MLEREMEDLIAANPDHFFPRHGFVLQARQQSFRGVGRFDLLFTDRHGMNILMELKAVPARYEAIDQVARYRDALLERGATNILLWIVAPSIPPTMREFLSHLGIEFTEISEFEFKRAARSFGYVIRESPARKEGNDVLAPVCFQETWGFVDLNGSFSIPATFKYVGNFSEGLASASVSMNNVWQSRKVRDGWSAPTPFLEKSCGVYDFMPTASGNAYVGSEPSPEDAKNGITYSYSVLTISEQIPTVKSLGQPVNEPGFNGDLYVAPDESYLIVSANETKTYESELYISFRKPDSTWTKPVSLSPKINSGLAHRWGQYVTPDGKYLFFTQGASEKDCAVYWVRFDKLLEELRPKQL